MKLPMTYLSRVLPGELGGEEGSDEELKAVSGGRELLPRESGESGLGRKDVVDVLLGRLGAFEDLLAGGDLKGGEGANGLELPFREDDGVVDSMMFEVR
jgi:hypothetical protein